MRWDFLVRACLSIGKNNDFNKWLQNWFKRGFSGWIENQKKMNLYTFFQATFFNFNKWNLIMKIFFDNLFINLYHVNRYQTSRCDQIDALVHERKWSWWNFQDPAKGNLNRSKHRGVQRIAISRYQNGEMGPSS